MTLFMLFLGFLMFALLVSANALKPPRSILSMFELRRREAAGNREAAGALRREELLGLAAALKAPLTGLLIVAMTASFVMALGWARGVPATLLAVLLSGRIAGLTFIGRLTKNLYRRREEAILAFLAKHTSKLRFLCGQPALRNNSATFGSREELLHAIDASRHILSADDKKLVTGALAFRQRRAGEIMTARENIIAVAHTELLGPLVLHDLHKTGHSCFPVINGDIDHVIGMLDTRSQFALEAKRSLTAAKTMTPNVFSIKENQTLDDALAMFVHTRHHLLMVVDAEGRTIGLISLGDVLKALFGEQITDAPKDG